MENQWVKKDIPVEPNPGVQVTFTYDQPYTDKFGNNKWLCVDGQYVQCSPTLLKMLESQNIKANMPVTIGKRQIDGKSHFTVNGQTASELLQGGGGAPQGAFQAQPNVPPMAQPVPVQQVAAAPATIGTPQPPNNSGMAELKVHLESALKLVNSLNVNDQATTNIAQPPGDDLPF
tara:strand:- start:322 stop:846 length:525 start_codon:yes stop_codon:yes gene_type:complete